MAEFLNERDKKVLELEARREIYEVVKEFAGCHFREIGRKSRLPTGTVAYHLAYLVKHGLIKEEKYENKVRYFPREFQSSNKKLLGLLRQKTIRNIILFIATHPNSNHERIVRSVNISPSTVSWHIKKLEYQGIIRFTKIGRKTFYNLIINKEEIYNLLITYKESFFDSLVDNVLETWDFS